MFEFDIDWDEHSGACGDVHVFGFICPSYFSVQYMFPEEWCGKKGFTLAVDFVLVSFGLKSSKDLLFLRTSIQTTIGDDSIV